MTNTPNIITQKSVLPEEVRAVGACDIDDFSHDFVGPRLRSLGIAYEDWRFFTIEDNIHLTREQLAMVRKVFNDPSFYRRMEFYHGFYNVMRPAEDFGSRIIMGTNCPEPESAIFKRYHIHRNIKIPDEDVMTFITGKTSQHALQKKPLPPKMLFLGDDAIHNLVNSDAEYLIAMEKPWNRSPELRASLADRKVYWVKNGDFDAVNEIIYSLCQEHYRQVTS